MLTVLNLINMFNFESNPYSSFQQLEREVGEIIISRPISSCNEGQYNILMPICLTVVPYVIQHTVACIWVPYLVTRSSVVAITFHRRYKRSVWRFCACAIYEFHQCAAKGQSIYGIQYYGLFVRMYITFQKSYLPQSNTTQMSFEVYFDSKRKSRHSSAP